MARISRARRRWRAGLLQLIFTAVGIVLGIALVRIDAGPTVTTSRSVEVLGAIGFGILGLVSLIYSLLFLVVQASNTTLTPRLNLFQDDPWIWRTYALALGLFAFSMTAFLEIGSATEVTVAVPIVAFVAALVVIALIRHIQATAFTSLQVNATLDRLQRSGREVIENFYPLGNGAAVGEPVAVALEGARPVVWTGPQSILQQLDVQELVASAEAARAKVTMRIAVGSAVREGAVLADVEGPLDDDDVLDACVTAVNRTFDQDPLLAFRLLADIGLRAASPAINDPATAVQSVEGIVGLLSVLAGRDLAVGAVEDDEGVVRVQLALPQWVDFVTEGLDDLLAVARNLPLLRTRAIGLLNELAEQCPHDRRAEIERRLHAIRSC